MKIPGGVRKPGTATLFSLSKGVGGKKFVRDELGGGLGKFTPGRGDPWRGLFFKERLFGKKGALLTEVSKMGGRGRGKREGWFYSWR